MKYKTSKILQNLFSVVQLLMGVGPALNDALAGTNCRYLLRGLEPLLAGELERIWEEMRERERKKKIIKIYCMRKMYFKKSNTR